MKYFNIICFLLCTILVVGCGTQNDSSKEKNSEVEIAQMYIYKQNKYEKLDTKDEVAAKVEEAVNKIFKENSTSLESIDGSMIWGKAEENKQINKNACYVEIVFAEKEKISVANGLSYDNITAIFVNVRENLLYLSQKEDVLESGNFGIGLTLSDEFIEQYFYDLD